MNSSKTKVKERLRKGERVRKNGTYEYRYTLNGKTKSLYAKTLPELRKKKDELRENDYNKSIKSTLNDVYDQWIVRKNYIKPNTKSSYIEAYKKHVYGDFGKWRIEDIKRSDIKDFYYYLYTEKHLSVSYIDIIQNVIYQLFEYLIDDDVTRYNPAAKATKDISQLAKNNDRKKAKKPKHLTQEQENKFLEFLKNNVELIRWYRIFKFMLRTGVRSSEFSALQKEDVDFIRKEVHINKDIVDYQEYFDNGKMKTHYVIQSTKTEAGNRTIPLSDDLIELLNDEIKYQKNAGIKCCSEVGGYRNFLFLNKDGKFYKNNTLNKALSRIIEKYNEDQIRKGASSTELLPRISCHKCRHSFNTRLAENDIIIDARNYLMGHAGSSVNEEVYTHMSPDTVRAKLEIAFSEHKS